MKYLAQIFNMYVEWIKEERKNVENQNIERRNYTNIES